MGSNGVRAAVSTVLHSNARIPDATVCPAGTDGCWWLKVKIIHGFVGSQRLRGRPDVACTDDALLQGSHEIWCSAVYLHMPIAPRLSLSILNYTRWLFRPCNS